MRTCLLLFFLGLTAITSADEGRDSSYYQADHPYVEYTGRIDRSVAGKPRFWAPGAYITLRFQGTYLAVELTDEVRWGTSHNYIQVIVDNKKSYRLQLKGKQNRLVLASGLNKGAHTVVICKNTEAEIGFLELNRIICRKLLKPVRGPKKWIEFIGNSITCGMGNDDSEVPCKSREWYDQHNAYMAYGPLTARQLKAKWQLSSVSGIGLIRSCCNKTLVMPQVFDKINMAEDKLPWDFRQYQPDLVTVCLGQNDGIQDSASFCDAYTRFVRQLRSVYPNTFILLLNSPMADPVLDSVLKKYILAVKTSLHRSGELQIDHFFFSQRYYKGCDAHPNAEEHVKMSAELSGFIRKRMRW